jgi:hypothetical protein
MVTSTNKYSVHLKYFSLGTTFSNKRKLVKIDTNPMAGKTKQKDGVGGRNKPTIKRIALKAYSE